MMNLVRCVNSTYNEVQRNLEILQKENFIVEKRLGRKRQIGLNRNNPKVKTLLDVLKALDKEDMS